jgi:hypothetical protein
MKFIKALLQMKQKPHKITVHNQYFIYVNE